jgi:aromatic-L-amino-acid decarboxylase
MRQTIRKRQNMDNDSFRHYGHMFVDWVADYFERIGELPVKPPCDPGDVRTRLPENPPVHGEPMDRIFKDFQEIIFPGITHWQHPSWFAYFPANNSPPSILAELLTAGIGVQCMVWQTSPSAAELEEVVLDWLRQMLGLPEGMTGVIQDAASMATLVALLSAREKATNFTANQKGIQSPLTVYASEETHSSIEKGVKVAGYGKENLRYIPTDEKFAMIPEKLEEAIIGDKKNGFHPACAVGTVGTTSSTAVDPLDKIGTICRSHNVWFHVDAAFSGTAGILPEKRWMLDGVEHVDSFVFNPHKWMLTNFDCSAYFVKDEGALIRTFEIHREYLKTRVDTEVKNYRDWGIQLGRRFRALKLWFVIRSYGVEGLQKIVREHIRWAEMFRDWVEQDALFELMAPVPVSLVCFRLNDGRAEGQLNELNKRFLERLNQTGKMLLTQTSLRGKYVLRMSIGARLTEEKHVREAWDLIRSVAEEVIR